MKKLIVIFYYNIIILYNNNNNMNLSKTRNTINLRTTKKTRKNQQTGGSQYKYLHNKLNVKKQSLDKNLKKVFEEFLENILKNKSSRLNNIVQKYGVVYKIPGTYGKQILIGVCLLYFNFIGYIKSKSSSKDLHLTLINIYQLLLGLSLIRTVMDTYMKKKSTNTILTKLGKNLYGLLPHDIKMRDINILMFNNILIYLYIVFCYVLDSLGILINFEFPQNYYKNLSFFGNSSYKDKKTFEIKFKNPRTSFLTEWEKQISKVRRELNHPDIKRLFNKLEEKFNRIDKTNYDRKSSKLKNKLKDIYKDIETLKNLSEGRRGTSRNSREISDENLSTLILLMHKKMCKAYYLYKDLQETKNIDDDDIESFFKYYFRMYDSVIKKTSESNNSKELLDFFYDIDFKITDTDNPYNGLYKEMGTNKLGRLIDKMNMAFVGKFKSI